MNKPKPILQATGLDKTYGQGAMAVPVLTGIDLTIAAGEQWAVVGASGSGKSTLLHVLAGLDAVNAGTLSLAGQDVASLSDAARSQLRNRSLGFVYQFHHLLPELTALENVMLPLLIRRELPASAEAAAQSWLAKVGLANRVSHKPSELSGGERQRVAIARALVTEPALILADEPTGNLDRGNAQAVFELFVGLGREQGTALVLVTHDHELANQLQNRVELRDGRLQALN